MRSSSATASRGKIGIYELRITIYEEIFVLRGYAAKDEEEFECRILDVLNSAGVACGELGKEKAPVSGAATPGG